MTRHNTLTRLVRPACLLGGILLLLIAALVQVAPASAQGGGTHTVQSGENLFRIALSYNMTVDTLAAANGITNPTRIYAGQVLVIPGPDAPAPNPAPAPVDPAPAEAPAYHTVQAGQTLASIGRMYGVNWTEIAALNSITNPNQIYPGQQLLISGSGTPAPAAPPVNPAPAAPTGTERRHVVQRGEHLSAIARQYGISWPTIARANGITNPNHIYAGQSLIIPAGDDGQGGFGVAPVTPPSPTITSGKQVVVELSTQRVYAYENGQLLRTVIASTGLPATPTVRGDFRIYAKYTSQAMSGPGYYLPGVPYIMYFYQGYGLHGTYWHNNFGQPMSRGCVNLPTPEAEWFFNWAEIGTPVRVQW